MGDGETAVSSPSPITHHPSPSWRTNMIDPKDEIEFLRSLRSVRQFRPEPVPQEVVDDLLTVARWSGSSVNRQPWEFVVVRDKETLKALADVGGYVKHLAGAALAIVLVMAGEHDVDETYDEGRLSERIMLAAKTHGVGACIGWFAPSEDHKAKAILGIPKEKTVR